MRWPSDLICISISTLILSRLPIFSADFQYCNNMKFVVKNWTAPFETLLVLKDVIKIQSGPHVQMFWTPLFIHWISVSELNLVAISNSMTSYWRTTAIRLLQSTSLLLDWKKSSLSMHHQVVYISYETNFRDIWTVLSYIWSKND